VTRFHFGRLGAVLIALCLVIPASASAASVTPAFVAGNPSCADYGLSGLKKDSQNVDGTLSDGKLTVVISQAHSGGAIDSWSSNIGVDKVIVKGGAGPDGVQGSNVYSYDPAATGDTNLVPPNDTGLSHVEFCYGATRNPPPPPPTCQQAHAGSPDSDGDGIVDACDNCPNVANMDQKDSDNNGVGDACEPAPPVNNPGPTGGDQPATTDQPQQPAADQQQTAPAADSGQAPAGQQPTGEQLVLGERIASPTARLLAATGCISGGYAAGVRGTQIARVIYRLDGKRIATVTKRNAKGLYALRINATKLRIGVHRLTVTVVFNAGTGTRPKTLRSAFQRCAKQLLAPRFTG
jgi:hypothetical protein